LSFTNQGIEDAECKDYVKDCKRIAMDSLQKSIAASTSIEESVIPRRRRAMTEGEDKVK